LFVRSSLLGLLLTFSWVFQLSPLVYSARGSDDNKVHTRQQNTDNLAAHAGARTYHQKQKKHCSPDCQEDHRRPNPQQPPRPIPRPKPLPEPIPIPIPDPLPDPLPEPKPIPVPDPCGCGYDKLCPQTEQPIWYCPPDPVPIPDPCGCPPDRYCIMQQTAVLCPIYEAY